MMKVNIEHFDQEVVRQALSGAKALVIRAQEVEYYRYQGKERSESKFRAELAKDFLRWHTGLQQLLSTSSGLGAWIGLESVQDDE